jgi:hypothetical protein
VKLDVEKGKNDEAWLPWILSAAACFLLVFTFSGKVSSPFWDYRVYQKGLECFSNGLNPYTCDAGGLPFVYPPIFLKIFSAVDFSAAFTVLLAASAAGIGYTCIKLKPLIPYYRLIPSIILGFLIGGSGFTSILTGNISVFSHLILVSLSYFLYRRRSALTIAPHVIAVIFFSAIKPYFLAYALLYLFLPKRMLIAFSVTLLSVAGIYILQPVFYPELWTGFQGAIYDQIVRQGDGGLTLFGALSKFGMGKIGIILHGVLMLFIALVSLVLRRRHGRDSLKISSTGELFYFLAILILLNPRLMPYDFSIFSVCLYLSMIISSRGEGWAGLFLRTLPFLTILPLCLDGLLHIRIHSLTYYFLATYVLLVAAVVCHWPLRTSRTTQASLRLQESATPDRTA